MLVTVLAVTGAPIVVMMSALKRVPPYKRATSDVSS
jgi:hypothetical protein